MGNSGLAPNGSYRFADHQRYLDAWFDAMGVNRNVILVVHDWGSALGFSWAQRHPERVKAIVYMEAIVRPFLSWDEWPDTTRELFKAQRTAEGEALSCRRISSSNTCYPFGISLRRRWKSIAVLIGTPGCRACLCWPGRENCRSKDNPRTFLGLWTATRGGALPAGGLPW